MGILIFLSLMSVLALSTLSFVVSQYMHDASFADVVWGVYFISIAIGLLLQVAHPTALQYLDASLVSLWGIRLTYHIMQRKVGKPEDWRYAKWRKDWGEDFARRSLAQNFWLQGALAVVISLSTIVAAHASTTAGRLHLWQLIPLAVWLLGFSLESTADWQLTTFLKTRHSKSDIMQSGLWRYSRHPNYFGEICQWWALWLLVLALPYGWFALASPLTITGLLLFVSGPTLLERKYRSSKAYVSYAKRTSVLLPLPPKS